MQTRHAMPKGTKSHFLFAPFFSATAFCCCSICYCPFRSLSLLPSNRVEPAQIGPRRRFDTKSRTKKEGGGGGGRSSKSDAASTAAWIYSLTTLVCVLRTVLCTLIALHYIKWDGTERGQQKQMSTISVGHFYSGHLIPTDNRPPPPLSEQSNQIR